MKVRTHKRSVAGFEMRKDGGYMSFVLPCLSFDDFDRTENLAVWKICRIFQGARIESLFTEGFLWDNPEQFWKDYTFFIMVTEYNFSRRLYIISSTNGYNTPLRLSNRVVDVGRTSFIFKSEIADETDKEVLATLTFRYVMIERKTRRPSPVPDSLRSRLKAILTGETVKSFDRLTLQPFSAVLVCQFEVQPSDTDSNGHMNNTSYIRMCHDAVSKASCQNRLRGITSDIAHLNVERMRVIYISEVRMGDRIEVYVWQDKTNDELILFDMRSCSTNKSNFQCTMKFYRSQAML